MPRSRRVVRAGLWAAALSGAPSTAWALARGDDPLAATLAAGAMLLPDEGRRSRLIPAAAVVHLALSLGWAAVLDAATRRGNTRRAVTRHGHTRHEAWQGALFGLGIAALDLGVAHGTANRRMAAIRALPVPPQVADHVAFGAVTAAVLVRAARC